MVTPWRHDHRHAPDDAVASGPDREQAAAGGGLLEHGRAQQAANVEHERAAAPAEHRKSGDRQLFVQIARHWDRRITEHHARILDGVARMLSLLGNCRSWRASSSSRRRTYRLRISVG